jgi:putative transcriptional regulator
VNDELFNELLDSVEEGGAILRGEIRPARTFVMDASSIRGIRERYNLSQGKFASRLGISVGTLRNWEQGRRVPEGPAARLLQVASEHPDIVLGVELELEHS